MTRDPVTAQSHNMLSVKCRSATWAKPWSNASAGYLGHSPRCGTCGLSAWPGPNLAPCPPSGCRTPWRPWRHSLRLRLLRYPDVAGLRRTWLPFIPDHSQDTCQRPRTPVWAHSTFPECTSLLSLTSGSRRSWWTAVKSGLPGMTQINHPLLFI